MDDQDTSTDELDRLSPLKVLQGHSASASSPLGASPVAPQPTPGAPVQAAVAQPQPVPVVSRGDLLRQAAEVPSSGFILPTLDAPAASVPVPPASVPVSPPVPTPAYPPVAPPAYPPYPQTPAAPAASVTPPVQPPQPVPLAPTQLPPTYPAARAAMVPPSVSPPPSLPQSPQAQQPVPSPASFQATPRGRSGSGKKLVLIVLALLVFGGAGTSYALVLKGMRIPVLYKALSGLPDSGTEVNKQALAYLNGQSSYGVKGSVSLKIPESSTKPTLPTTQDNGVAGEVYSLDMTFSEGGFFDKGQSYLGKALLSINNGTGADMAIYVGSLSTSAAIQAPSYTATLASSRTASSALTLQAVATASSSPSPSVSTLDTVSDSSSGTSTDATDAAAATGDATTEDTTYELDSVEPLVDDSTKQVAVNLLTTDSTLETISVAPEEVRQTALYTIFHPLSLESVLGAVRGERAYAQQIHSDGTRMATYSFDGDEKQLEALMPTGATLSNIIISGAYYWKKGSSAAGEPRAVVLEASLKYQDKTYAYKLQWQVGNWGKEPVLTAEEGKPTLGMNPVADELSIDDFVSQLGIYSIDSVPNSLDGNGTDGTLVDGFPFSESGGSTAATAPVAPTGEGITTVQPAVVGQTPTSGQPVTEAAKARDTQRLKDLNDLKTALQAYKTANGSYPVVTTVQQTGSCQTLLTALLPKYITKIPVDPLKSSFYYGYYSDGTSFRLTAVVEDPSFSGAKKGSSFSYLEITN